MIEMAKMSGSQMKVGSPSSSSPYRIAKITAPVAYAM